MTTVALVVALTVALTPALQRDLRRAALRFYDLPCSWWTSWTGRVVDTDEGEFRRGYRL